MGENPAEASTPLRLVKGVGSARLVGQPQGLGNRKGCPYGSPPPVMGSRRGAAGAACSALAGVAFGVGVGWPVGAGVGWPAGEGNGTTEMIAPAKSPSRNLTDIQPVLPSGACTLNQRLFASLPNTVKVVPLGYVPTTL